LRERDQLTFGAIAKLLTKSGTRSVSGCLLGAGHVFYVDKNDSLKGERLALKVESALLDLRYE
jgi:hypothetical protein